MATPTESVLLNPTAIIIHPNPVHHQLSLTNNSHKAIKGCYIYNLAGQLMISQHNIVNTIHSIDVADFQAGAYFIKIQLDDGTMSNQKFMKY